LNELPAAVVWIAPGAVFGMGCWGCLVWFGIVALLQGFPLPVWTLSAGGYLSAVLMLAGFGWLVAKAP
jgi:hypothetical protein